MAEANCIFGFDGLDREAISSEYVWTKQIDGRHCAAYVTGIRIRVRAGEASVVREGSGAGESNAASPGQAHEFASKAAETDATKRALMTFGNAFGLLLYSGVGEPRNKSASAGGSMSAKSPAEVDKTGAPLAGADLLTDQSRSSSAEPYSRSQSDTVKATLPMTLPGPTWPEMRPLEEAARLDRERQDRIDKSRLALSEPRRERDLGHLAFVASKPCLICGRNRTHAHHLKFAQPTAVERKVSDEFTVPLCSVHHRELHAHGDERVWWRAHGIDALAVAQELWFVRHPRTNEAAAEADSAAGPS